MPGASGTSKQDFAGKIIPMTTEPALKQLNGYLDMRKQGFSLKVVSLSGCCVSPYADSQTCLSFPSTWPHAKLQNPKYSLFSSQPEWRNVRITISAFVGAHGGTWRLVISKTTWVPV